MKTFKLKQERKKRDRQTLNDICWVLATALMVVYVTYEGFMVWTL